MKLKIWTDYTHHFNLDYREYIKNCHTLTNVCNFVMISGFFTISSFAAHEAAIIGMSPTRNIHHSIIYMFLIITEIICEKVQ
jgi:hypothetical protein